MSDVLAAMRSLLSDEDRVRLEKIYAPVKAAVPHEDARRCLCVMPDGEIRSYYKGGYLASRDCGLSFREYNQPQGSLGASVNIPDSDIWLTVAHTENGAVVRRNTSGPDFGYTEKLIAEGSYDDLFQPFVLNRKDGSKRIFVTANHTNDTPNNDGNPSFMWNSAVFISDDLGENWRVTELPYVKMFEEKWPHSGKRWENSGSENHITLLPDGRLMIIMRTSQNFFYASYSDDEGDTWSEPEPSIFHGTLTTPYLLRLHDGRVVVFWNNTQPLPELDHRSQGNTVGEAQIRGTWEDVFTNRDACHAAITENGTDFIGFREVWLNEVRGNADFRSIGFGSADKSVHQFQAIELPYNKIMLQLGQNESSRRIVIFDINWLYDKERTENFSGGLGRVSTHLYVKSYGATTVSGHCAYNRTNGALLVPEPEHGGREALQICRICDPRLVSDKQGLTWNFPAADSGSITVRMYLAGEGAVLSLTDRWHNPCDEATPWEAGFAVNIDSTTVPTGRLFDYTISWNKNKAEILIDGKAYRHIVAHNSLSSPISYLHIITKAEHTDPLGLYILEMSMTKE